MPHKRGAASPTRTASAKHRKTSHHGARANTQKKPADTIAPLTSRTDAQDQNTAFAPSVIICEYCSWRGDKLSQQQLMTLPEADDVENHGKNYRAGDMVKVKVRSKGQKSRLERAVIAEIGDSSVFLAWLFETEITKARKQLLEGKVDPSHKFILSSHADTVPVDALAGLVSPNERKEVCTDWVLHSNAAQVICITELRDSCFMRSLVEKVRAREPNEGSAAPSGAPGSTLPQQETNSPSAPEQEENGELADLQNQPTPFPPPVEQLEALASVLDPEALELEKQRKEEEGRAKAGARKRTAEDARMAEEAKKMSEEDPKVEKRCPILGARGSSPEGHETKEENTNAFEISTLAEDVRVRDRGKMSAATFPSSCPVAPPSAPPGQFHEPSIAPPMTTPTVGTTSVTPRDRTSASRSSDQLGCIPPQKDTNDVPQEQALVSASEKIAFPGKQNQKHTPSPNSAERSSSKQKPTKTQYFRRSRGSLSRGPFAKSAVQDSQGTALLQSGNLSNKKHSRSASSSRFPRTAKRHKLGAPPSTVSLDVPGEELSSVPTLADQLAFLSDEHIASGEGRRASLSQRGAIMDTLKTNCRIL